MGKHVNGPVSTMLGWGYFCLICALAVAAPVLLVVTRRRVRQATSGLPEPCLGLLAFDLGFLGMVSAGREQETAAHGQTNLASEPCALEATVLPTASRG